MKIINFAHPLTPANFEEIAGRVGDQVEVISVHFQIEHQYPLEPQVEDLVDGLGLTPREWQTGSFLFNLPSLNYGAAVLLAHLHGRTGYFPAILRLRPVEGSLPVRFEVAEIINLQAVRERARRMR
ncbi:CRISPR-associated protein Csx15 [Moorella sp. Hama-1]|uniref:CRISPR-associated protein Csx15 n=1 Tax=Moorella sp. Hama-1 TaxID=2138101 RepID=UPI000D64B21C|nr:CRISPR-associated protein Csx15 [Moorella sp. Hama-1]